MVKEPVPKIVLGRSSLVAYQLKDLASSWLWYGFDLGNCLGVSACCGHGQKKKKKVADKEHDDLETSGHV